MLTSYEVASGDFTMAGNVSSQVKRTLKQLGIPPKTIKRITVALFEAEVNMIAYSVGGRIDFEVTPEKVFLRIADGGPGIPDLGLAMEEGWSTATEEIREMGYGAGMGLPNMRKNADDLAIRTGKGQGTEIRLTFLLGGPGGNLDRNSDSGPGGDLDGGPGGDPASRRKPGEGDAASSGTRTEEARL